MDADKPCRCPRCGWLGTIHDAEAYQPLAHLEPLNIRPRCASETEVQPLGQKGLDALCREYALLLKPGYQPQGDRAERRAQLERFFEHIDHPPRSTSGPNLFEAFKVIDESDKKRDRAFLKCLRVRHYRVVTHRPNPALARLCGQFCLVMT